ncbi:restriction endonuclease [Leptospira mtsangambouensis]|uniref:Restriction endonuclease n=1 Tax=Leptospira mtsangambouensis TaxID=2484912 RepID=A0ABY2NZP3_9LEPT|nr:restriction endonuclease [Leptospira mtsangambouensis]TGM74272.1 restriction endonuclease [Leptospira mtsangambouensis]
MKSIYFSNSQNIHQTDNFINIIKNELEYIGYKTTTSIKESNFEETLEETTETLIRNCSIMISMYQKSNNFVHFELGMAYALRKPIVLITEDEFEIPEFLSNTSVIILNKMNFEDVFGTLNKIIGQIEVNIQDSRIIEANEFFLSKHKGEKKEFENLTPQELEEIFFEIFECLSFSPKKFNSLNDNRFDFKLENYEKYDNAIVEIKKYNYQSKISISQIEQFYGVVMANNAQFGIYITSSQYTASALNFAEKLREKVKLYTLATFYEEYKDKLKKYCV